MKRFLLLAGLLAFLGYLMATPGPDHKVYWCHYPPGQWTGVPGTASHVLILSIDVAAEPGHLGHSPSYPAGTTCDPSAFNGTSATGCAEGVTADGMADECPGVVAPAPTCPAALQIQVCAFWQQATAGVPAACTATPVTNGAPTSNMVNLDQGPLTVGPGGPVIGDGFNGCVCPVGTDNAGSQPNPAGDPTGAPENCGTAT